MNAGKNLIGFIAYLLYLRRPDSQTTQVERQLISKYAKNASLAVEIGVYEGLNTCIIAESMGTNGVLYGIDPFFKGRLGISYSKRVAKINLKRRGFKSKVILVEKLSFDASDDIPDGIDFLFIDGDHSYEGLKKDWELWFPKLRKGGIIALHDTYQSKEIKTYRLGSYKYFKEVILGDQRFDFLEFADSLSILQRK